MKSNSKLLAECASFERMRFFAPHRADHVMMVIDAYRVEDIILAVPGPPGQAIRDDFEAFVAYCQSLKNTVVAHMRNLAFASMTQDIREREEQNFHACVLFWERESVFLAGAEILRETRKLDLPREKTTSDGILKTRCPTDIVKEAWLAKSGLKYSKPINGP